MEHLLMAVMDWDLSGSLPGSASNIRFGLVPYILDSWNAASREHLAFVLLFDFADERA
jgi:hypothetical protein